MILHKASASHKLLGHVTPSDVFDESVVFYQSLSSSLSTRVDLILPACTALLAVNACCLNPGGLAALALMSFF